MARIFGTRQALMLRCKRELTPTKGYIDEKCKTCIDLYDTFHPVEPGDSSTQSAPAMNLEDTGVTLGNIAAERIADNLPDDDFYAAGTPVAAQLPPTKGIIDKSVVAKALCILR